MAKKMKRRGNPAQTAILIVAAVVMLAGAFGLGWHFGAESNRFKGSILLVNEQNRLREDYVPDELVNLYQQRHSFRLASSEIFFPLRPCPEHRGVYPVIGRMIEGMDEIRRLERVPTRRVDFPIPGVEVNEPLEPQVIEKVELELFGETYPEPVRMAVQDLPPTWK